jgi:phospholipase D1/2
MTAAAIPPDLNPLRSVNQICDQDGKPYQAFLTDPVWVTRGDPYMMTEGNSVAPLLTGEAYFGELASAIKSAKKSIYMLGWQINWDVMLRPGLRLYDALLAAAKAEPALKIYVLPWEGSSFVPTYADETVAVLTSINAALHPGSKQVFAAGAPAMANSSDGAAMFFSHHQKQAVIDERLVFVGGIDVAYGRGDDASFSLLASSRHGNDSYNGCLPHLRAAKAHDFVDCARLNEPDTIDLAEGGSYQNSAAINAKAALRAGKVQYPAKGVEIDATRQPRMPWQDVHLKIEGPAASDLASNFVLRWNSANSTPRLHLPLTPANYAKPGSCQVQLLRSASGKMVSREAASVTKEERGRVHEKFTHNHIHHAMVRLIEKADHFIYIENQFFVSAFGTERFGDRTTGTPDISPAGNSAESVMSKWMTRAMPGNGLALPTNLVCEALGRKLRSVIMNCANPAPDGKTSRFHIYITLPVHSEGMLNDQSVMTQVHYTMQSLVFGSQSLVNRTRRAIKARQLWEQYDTNHARAFEESNREYEEVPIDDCWAYITLLNLRSWAKLGDRYVTEQIYVHTKAMIVDDRYALVGSANINDRSQLGDRDSEMAVLVMDTHHSTEDIGAVDGPQLTRKFARDLRMGIWTKMFALTGAKTVVKPAAALADAIKRPAAQGSWEAIRNVAELNSARYEAAFPFIPRNPGERQPGVTQSPPDVSIWPTKYSGRAVVPSGLMPFEEKFWTAPQHSGAASNLAFVEGFVTLLPWLWTRGENNNCGYHSALYVENDAPPNSKKVDGQQTAYVGEIDVTEGGAT